jgi:peptidoglycan/xylan/chitin deacetylase (PgdA/CDA1 family)
LIRKIALLLLFIICSLLTFGEVQFNGLDVSPLDRLIFKATTEAPEFGTYDTLFLASLKDRKLTQLTFFPEKIAFLKESAQLQIQNRFGVFRSDAKLESIAPVDLFPSFVKGHEIGTGKITPIFSSPDGKYLVYSRPTSPAFGDLILYDHAKSKATVIAEKVELSLRDPLVLWSPDSMNFVYSNRGNIYYFSINQYLENRIMAEDFRKVHEGTINSAHWGTGNSLYYIAGTLVYRIGSHEFFTKSLYSGLLQVGEIAGKIPFEFNPNFDRFWISPGGNKILLSKAGRNLFLYYLTTQDFITTGSPTSLPYLYLPRNTIVKRLIWSTGDSVTLLAQSIVKGESKTTLFRLDIDDQRPPSAFRQLPETEVREISLSPDQRSITLIKKDRILIYDYLNWTKVDEIPYVSPISVLWRSEREILIAGTYTIKLYNLNINTSKLIALSQPGDYGYTEDSQYIQTKIQEGVFQKKEEDTGWQSVRDFSIREREVATTSYRVYLESSSRGSYRNVIMVRNIMGYGTVPLLPPEEIAYEPFPQQDEQVNYSNFNHGSRLRRREVALVFDAIDSIEGLTIILNVLSEYRLKCTFFMNGEVIRRYPGAIKEIADSGHEVGSLFYTHFNMTDSKFTIDRQFIKQGLARTEDDYFAATGKEVSLLWHAPYYFVNSEIIQASKEMNYTYVGRDVDSMDWVTEDRVTLAPGIYLPASELLERIIEKKKPGSIVPIQIGIPEGKRQDYLFQKLDLLINSLEKLGYDIVPVSAMIEHSK